MSAGDALPPPGGPGGPQEAYYASTWALYRDAAAALAEAGEALASAARALRALSDLQHGEATPGGRAPLRGAALARAATEVARVAFPDGKPFHYRQLFAAVERAGHRVGGRDPLATFLTTLTRGEGSFESAGRRTGMYRLREED